MKLKIISMGPSRGTSFKKYLCLLLSDQFSRKTCYVCRCINSSKLLELRSMPHLKVLKYDSYDRNCVDLKRQKLKLFMPKLMKDKTYLNIANWNYEDWRHICWFYLVNLWCQIKEKFWIKPCLRSRKKMFNPPLHKN